MTKTQDKATDIATRALEALTDMRVAGFEDRITAVYLSGPDYATMVNAGRNRRGIGEPILWALPMRKDSHLDTGVVSVGIRARG